MSQPLAVTDQRPPEVSVLLVTYGAWEWTERCLAALVETTDAPYELICIDNASPDGSADRLASLPGIRLTRNAANLGYGVAADQAAMMARAPYLLLLNTDAIVQAGWLPPLRSILDAEDDVAAVSARLLHLDGRLQEAGSIIWGDGMTDCYGDGDDPQRPEYRFRRDVDYSSAACLLVRRSAFVDAGGFDPVYQPAYHEDTDLAMRWRSRGLRVVYQPLSTALHQRWASSYDRAATEQLVAHHRPIFHRRWQALIGGRPLRPVPEDPRALLAVRDAECGRRVLGVVDRISTAAGRAVGEVLSSLRADAGSRHTLVCAEEPADGPEAAALRAEGVEVAAAPDLAAWLADRRFHYTHVVAAPGLPHREVTDVVAGQPFATRVLLVWEHREDFAQSSWSASAHSAVSGREVDASWVRRMAPGLAVIPLASLAG